MASDLRREREDTLTVTEATRCSRDEDLDRGVATRMSKTQGSLRATTRRRRRCNPRTVKPMLSQDFLRKLRSERSVPRSPMSPSQDEFRPGEEELLSS